VSSDGGPEADVTETSAEPSANTSRQRLFYVLRLLVGVALLVYVFHKYDMAEVIQRLRQLQLHWYVLAWALSLVAPLLNSWKWQLILESYGQRDSVFRLWRLYGEGGFFNLLFPGFIAGDTSRAVRTSTSGALSVESVMAVFLERFSGLVVTLLFITVVALFGGYAVLGGGTMTGIGIATAGVLGIALLLLNVRIVGRVLPFLPRWTVSIVERFAVKTQHAVETVISHPGLPWKLGALSLLFLLLAVPLAYCVALSVRFPVPLAILTMYVPFIMFFSSLPVSISGIGVRENLALLLYTPLGFAPEVVLAYALAQSALGLIVNLSGGVVLLAPSFESSRRAENGFS
jgi:uncharacterized membrane protein YbhN (UPF0104 family)